MVYGGVFVLYYGVYLVLQLAVVALYGICNKRGNKLQLIGINGIKFARACRNQFYKTVKTVILNYGCQYNAAYILRNQVVTKRYVFGVTGSRSTPDS